ncbi:MAG: NAD-dependent epimerase/dehydratase family protein [Candidatus Nitricoxidivorans perseverans]|uniref:NAD-dependent epimerase/dehydratase family protein n=1 Tax=Candidatus Nitricoxidivorans perseverans TaxID=2975601 RepID=A0AA49FJX8_9PROT|nr:MAG: NAD-dependent epimerase/dehydratase family protein [Candidatus Nitricoxidivorans perseverans]
MKILILGGDGYLGWPTAMDLSSAGHEVAVADNYLRRRLMMEQGVEPLFPVPLLHERANLWKAETGREIEVHVGDLADWAFVTALFRSVRPDAIIHYAEQPSAPYSMLNRDAAMLTLRNNLETTGNLVYAVRQECPQAHIVKLGTMGEYGTPNIDIEEGWLDIEHKGRRDRFLFPRQAGSLYHTTKIMDTDLLWFYVRTWGMRVTDLMQGPVYGFESEEAVRPELRPFFNYDEIFGTVLNRFVVQAVAGYPLTVYGKGGQTRGYLNIVDTLNCVRLCVENPPDDGEMRILNQFVDVFSVNDLAEKVVRVGGNMGLDVQVQSLANPRVEREDHYYNPASTGLRDLGLKPHPLTDDVLAGLFGAVLEHKGNIKPQLFFSGRKWC